MGTEPSVCPRFTQPVTPGARFCSHCGSPSSPASPPSVGGGVPPDLPRRYRIERFLGRGGMGRVYLCHDEMLDVQVA